MPFTSRGAVLHKVGDPWVVQDIIWEDPRDDEVVVDIKYCGCCRSDLHVKDGDYPIEMPILTGHEGTGIVERVGKNVTKVKPGDHIVMSWMPCCGVCPYCQAGMGHLCNAGANLLEGQRNDGTLRATLQDGTPLKQFLYLGAFCTKIVTPQDGCIPIDKSFNMKDIPIIGCRVPTGIGSVLNVAGVKHGKTGLVIGLGGVGFSVIQGLTLVGATKIIAVDIVDNKEQWAKDFGATHYINAKKVDVVEEVMKITDGLGVDFAFDCIGKVSVQKQCMESIGKGGMSVIVGVTPQADLQVECNPLMMHLYERTLKGSMYGGANPFRQVEQILGMYKAGYVKLGELITKVYSLDQINEAYDDMEAGKNICGLIDLSL